MITTQQAADRAVIEAARKKTSGSKGVYEQSAEFVVLARYSDIPVRTLRGWSALKRWTYLVNWVVPGMSYDDARKVVDEAAEEITDEDVERAWHNYSLLMKAHQNSKVRKAIEGRKQWEKNLKQAERDYEAEVAARAGTGEISPYGTN